MKNRCDLHVYIFFSTAPRHHNMNPSAPQRQSNEPTMPKKISQLLGTFVQRKLDLQHKLEIATQTRKRKMRFQPS